MGQNASEIIKLLIVDDQQIIIDGLCSLLSDVAEVKIVGSCNDSSRLFEMMQKHQPNVVLMDLNMPGKDGIECIKEVMAEYPEQKILMLTGYDDIALIKEALKQGATGYVLKNIGKNELLTAIKQVATGIRFLDQHVQEKIIQSFTDDSNTTITTNQTTVSLDGLLSRREHEVLKMIADGKKSSEIAKLLFISVNTVDTHRKNIIAKCDVKNTAALISFANKNGLI